MKKRSSKHDSSNGFSRNPFITDIECVFLLKKRIVQRNVRKNILCKFRRKPSLNAAKFVHSSILELIL